MDDKIKTNTFQLHDKLNKRVLSDKKNAIDFFSSYLPEFVSKNINWQTLKVRPGSFIDANLKESNSDLLYSVKYKEDDIGLYILFEHKSYPDKFTVMQLLKYMIRIWEKERSEGKTVLSVIIPFVFYHGKKKFNEYKFYNLFKENKELRDFIPEFDYLLMDLSESDLKKIQKNLILKIFTDILKDTGKFTVDREDVRRLMKLFNELMHQSEGMPWLRLFIEYIINAKEGKVEEIVDYFEKHNMKKEGEVVMTMAETLMDRGMQRGLEQGLEQGIELERKEMAKRLFSKGMDIAEIAAITGLSESIINEVLNT